MSKKRVKIGAMYREYGEFEGVVCRNCCNFTAIAVDGKRHCKCRAYGITHDINTNWSNRYTACGLYNTPIDNKKYKPLVRDRTRNDGDERTN